MLHQIWKWVKHAHLVRYITVNPLMYNVPKWSDTL